jgi:hypothetical protein
VARFQAARHCPTTSLHAGSRAGRAPSRASRVLVRDTVVLTTPHLGHTGRLLLHLLLHSSRLERFQRSPAVNAVPKLGSSGSSGLQRKRSSPCQREGLRLESRRPLQGFASSSGVVMVWAMGRSGPDAHFGLVEAAAMPFESLRRLVLVLWVWQAAEASAVSGRGRCDLTTVVGTVRCCGTRPCRVGVHRGQREHP